MVTYVVGYQVRRRRRRGTRISKGTYVYGAPVQQPQYSYQQQQQQQQQQQPYPYQQQQQARVEPTISYTNPSAYTNPATPIYNNYEKPQPSYDAGSRDTRFTHPAPSAPVMYVPGQETNFRL